KQAAVPLQDVPKPDYRCSAAREYITAYNYLLDKKEFNLKHPEVSKLALGVAKGCSGAAARFVSVTETLISAKLDTSSALVIALQLAAKDDRATSAFTTVFRYAYLPDYLDLPLQDAVETAKRLSLQFVGDA